MDDTTATKLARGVWSSEEHERFVEAVLLFPQGPWIAIAERVGTRTVRQVQTHAQKYQDRAARRLRDLRHDHERMLRPKHEIEREMNDICASLQQCRVPLSPQSTGQKQHYIDQLAHASGMVFDEDAADGNISSSVPTFDECIDFLLEAIGSPNSGSK